MANVRGRISSTSESTLGLPSSQLIAQLRLDIHRVGSVGGSVEVTDKLTSKRTSAKHYAGLICTRPSLHLKEGARSEDPSTSRLHTKFERPAPALQYEPRFTKPQKPPKPLSHPRLSGCDDWCLEKTLLSEPNLTSSTDKDSSYQLAKAHHLFVLVLGTASSA